MKNNVITRIIQQTRRTIGKPNKEIKKINMQSNINMVVEFCKNLLRENPELTPEQWQMQIKNIVLNQTLKEFCFN